jgi:RNA polymerase sporulation-specific sigma factor
VKSASRPTLEEERLLSERWQQAKDLAARDRLVASVYAYIQREANRYESETTPADDLFQEGVLGAIRAADTFDPARGKFITYAAAWIRNEMVRRLGKDRTLLDCTDLLRGKQAAANARRGLVSTHPLEDSPDLPSAIPPPDDVAERLQLWKLIRAAGLTDDEIRVIEERYLIDPDGASLAVVGRRCGFSREQARLLERRALAKLRAAATEAGKQMTGEGEAAA